MRTTPHFMSFIRRIAASGRGNRRCDQRTGTGDGSPPCRRQTRKTDESSQMIPNHAVRPTRDDNHPQPFVHKIIHNPCAHCEQLWKNGNRSRVARCHETGITFSRKSVENANKCVSERKKPATAGKKRLCTLWTTLWMTPLDSGQPLWNCG